MDDEPQKVDVRRKQPKIGRQKPQRPPGLWWRINYALGPVLGGLLLDMMDLTTFGPLGLYFGLIVGGLVGWYISAMYGFSRNATIWCILLAGIYCMVPMTEFMPIATIISAVARFNPPVYHKKPPQH